MSQLRLDLNTEPEPPLHDDRAVVKRRDRGIRRAADHAREVEPGWEDRAVQFVREYARANSSFLAEYPRTYAENRGLPEPPDKRAWGHVMRRAAREHVIQSAGFAPARSSNLSPKVLWRSLIYVDAA